MAASRALRVRALLPRSCSRWSRNAPISGAFRSSMSKPRGRLADARGGEAQKHAHRVAVGGDRVLAGVALCGQALGEERLQGRGQGAHERASAWRSSRWAASCMSSGAADRYQ